MGRAGLFQVVVVPSLKTLGVRVGTLREIVDAFWPLFGGSMSNSIPEVGRRFSFIALPSILFYPPSQVVSLTSAAVRQQVILYPAVLLGDSTLFGVPLSDSTEL